MLKHIIIPLDGSPFGEQALPTARQLAERDGAEMELVHVYDAVAPYRFVHGAPVFDTRYDEELAKDRRKYVDSVADWLRSRTQLIVTGTVLAGNVREVLADHIKVRSPDVVVMTTHGRSGLSRLWLGSTAMHLVRNVKVPLLLIHPEEERSREESAPEIRRVLVPLDARPESERAIDNALEVAGRNSSLLLVHVLVPIVYIAPDAAIGAIYPSEAELLASAEKYLAQVADRLEGRGVKVEARVEWNSFPANAILELADRYAVDMIAMETQNVRGIERVLLGSVADKVVRAAKFPVLVQHPPESGVERAV